MLSRLRSVIAWRGSSGAAHASIGARASRASLPSSTSSPTIVDVNDLDIENDGRIESADDSVGIVLVHQLPAVDHDDRVAAVRSDHLITERGDTRRVDALGDLADRPRVGGPRNALQLRREVGAAERTVRVEGERQRNRRITVDDEVARHVGAVLRALRPRKVPPDREPRRELAAAVDGRFAR